MKLTNLLSAVYLDNLLFIIRSVFFNSVSQIFCLSLSIIVSPWSWMRKIQWSLYDCWNIIRGYISTCVIFSPDLCLISRSKSWIASNSRYKITFLKCGTYSSKICVGHFFSSLKCRAWLVIAFSPSYYLIGIENIGSYFLNLFQIQTNSWLLIRIYFWRNYKEIYITILKCNEAKKMFSMQYFAF